MAKDLRMTKDKPKKASSGQTSTRPKQSQKDIDAHWKRYYTKQRQEAEKRGDQETVDKIYGKIGRKQYQAPNVEERTLYARVYARPKAGCRRLAMMSVSIPKKPPRPLRETPLCFLWVEAWVA